jgi:hypothetical protein
VGAEVGCPEGAPSFKYTTTNRSVILIADEARMADIASGEVSLETLYVLAVLTRETARLPVETADEMLSSIYFRSCCMLMKSVSENCNVLMRNKKEKLKKM